MKRTTGLILSVLALVAINCSSPIFIKKGAASFSVVTEMHSYKIMVMKLPNGSIPTASLRIPIADTTTITFQWMQIFETTPYDEQPYPTDYGQSSDFTVYAFDNDDIVWETPAAAQSIAGVSNQFLSLGEGEYQVQISGSVWDPVNLQALWSKWSDAVGFYAYIPDEPPSRAKNVMIKLNK